MKETTGVLLICIGVVIVTLLCAIQLTVATERQAYCQEFGFRMGEKQAMVLKLNEASQDIISCEKNRIKQYDTMRDQNTIIKWLAQQSLGCPACNATANCTQQEKPYVAGAHNANACLGGKITGFSMQPTFFEGNTYEAETYSGQELKAGMIIAFDQNGATRIHRIKGIYPNYIITQGDNNDGTDEPITTNQIKSIVTKICLS